MAGNASAKTTRRPRHKRKPAAAAPAVVPAGDLAKRLAQWKRYPMTFDQSALSLSMRERQMVAKLVEAAQSLEDIYWRQSDPEGLELLEQLRVRSDPTSRDLLRLVTIMGSRFDLLAENAPFVKGAVFAPGRGLMPKDLTREELEQYVKQHPEKSAALYSGTTVIRRKGDDLVGVPYHVAYRDLLEPAAKALREAADLSDDPAFAKFLRLRADALLSDDYYASDLAWMELKDPKVDIIFAPYETYLDDVLGVKTSYGAAVMVRNEKESAKLAVFQKYVPDIQDALPLAPEDRPSKRGHLTPMEVMDTPYRAGDLRHGYQAVADNLPNDPRIHQEKGSKKLFFKNYMDARVNVVILPIALRLMRADQAAKASGEGYLADTLMHEISHGLGPSFARSGGQQVDIRQAIGPTYSALEEAKADAVGMFGLKWLVDHGAFPADRLEECYASYLAGMFRTVRFSVAEAHGRAEMMEFNFLTAQGAVRKVGDRYEVDYARMPAAVAKLAQELLEIEATGDGARADAWFKKYDSMPAELQSALRSVSDIPVDIDPVQPFPEPVQ
jgi:peptidase M49-like protein